jgi:hypothetical protein
MFCGRNFFLFFLFFFANHYFECYVLGTICFVLFVFFGRHYLKILTAKKNRRQNITLLDEILTCKEK